MKNLRLLRSCLLNKINSNSKRSTDIIKNILASFGVKGISIIIQLLLVPLTIGYVNPSQYGIWLTLSSIIAWFSFFDIGFGNGLRNRFAEARVSEDYKKAKAYISTTYICLAIIFSVIWVLFFLAHSMIEWDLILNAPSEMAKELAEVSIIIVSFFCLQIILKTINTILIADQKPAKSAFFDMLGQLLCLIIIFILTKFTSGSLTNLSLVLGICPVVIMSLSSFFLFTGDYSKYRPSIFLFDITIVKDILSLGSKFFYLQIAAVIIFQVTNIIITQVLNPTSVTIYNITWRYFGVIIMLSSIIFSPFWSAFTDAFKQNDYSWMRDSLKKLTKVAVFLSLGAGVMLMLSPFAYKLWIGDSVQIPFNLSVVMFLITVSSIFTSLQFQLLNGMGKLKVQLIVVSIGILFNVPFSIILSKYIGIIGVVLPTLVFNIVSYLIYSHQLKLLVHGNGKGVWNK
jgi:O-antigen/teichoic acid export membrane protein